MNIFVVDDNPTVAAKQLCDEHIRKMIIEAAQMLSTAHRVLDGQMYFEKTSNGRKIKRWRLTGDLETSLYKACFVNHPCSIWVRQSTANYFWLYSHYFALSEEYTRRYQNTHGAFYNNDIGKKLSSPPVNIQQMGRTPYAIAMKEYPHCIVQNNAIQSYRNYYNQVKSRFATWKNSQQPSWFSPQPIGEQA